MLVNDSSSSNQSVQRQRRHAADERLRVEKARNEAAVRESVARQIGEAPSRDEIDRFRALMRAAEDARGANSRPASRTASTPQAVAPPPSLGAEAAPTLADRFRALLLQSPGGLGGRDDGGKAPLRDGRQADGKPDANLAADDGERASASATPPGATLAHRASAHAMGKEPPVGKLQHQADDGDGRPVREHATTGANASQKPPQKAAEGDANLVSAARQAQRGGPAQEGEETSSNESSTAGAQSFVPHAAAPDAPMPVPQGTGDAPQQAAATAGNTAPALAALLEKHVKQMLVSDPRSLRGQSREVLLRMQSDVLPGTDLWLSQTRNGWQLRADVRSRDAYDTLLANQEELIQRFADGALGELTIEPVFHA